MANQNTNLDFQDTKNAFEHKSNKELKKSARLFKLMGKDSLVNFGATFGLKAIRWNLPFAKTVVRNTIFAQFCGGTSLAETQTTINELYDSKVQTILDYGAEAKSSESDFNRTMSENLSAIDFGSTNQSVPIISCKITGLARFALLEKIQKGETLLETEQKEWDNVKHRVDTICHHAKDKQVGVFFDAEETWIQDAIDDLVDEMMEKYNTNRVAIYNTFQMYRKDRLDFLMKSHQRALQKGYLLGAKLVRGAYMEKERNRAEEMGYTSPIQDSKNDTDTDFNAGLKYCLENYKTIASCNATHNEFSNYYQAEMVEQLEIPKGHTHVNSCQLYGMGDHITFNLAKKGFGASKYVPYGTIEEVVPYLIRRAQENSSVSGEVGRELGLIQKEIKRRRI